MPNLNRAPQRQLNALADKRVPHAELIPLMQQDREAYAQHMIHLNALWAHRERKAKTQFQTGIEAAIAIIEERGKRIMGAIQPDRTVNEIRERLLP